MSDPQTLSLEGLRPDQIRRLTKMRDEMLGWEPVGFAVEHISDDYLIGYDGKTGSPEKAMMPREEAIAWCDRQIADDAEELGEDEEFSGYRIVVVYRKGDEYDTHPEEDK